MGFIAMEDCPSRLKLPHCRIWTKILKFFSIEIPVANTAADDHRGDRRAGRVAKVVGVPLIRSLAVANNLMAT